MSYELIVHDWTKYAQCKKHKISTYSSRKPTTKAFVMSRRQARDLLSFDNSSLDLRLVAMGRRLGVVPTKFCCEQAKFLYNLLQTSNENKNLDP